MGTVNVEIQDYKKKQKHKTTHMDLRKFQETWSKF